MATRIVERGLVKDMLGIARADLAYDSVLNALIAQASDDTEKLTRRFFEKKERTEYLRSYDMLPSDPTPQYLLVSAYPIDNTAQVIITWGHTEVGRITLDAQDFVVEEEDIVVNNLAFTVNNTVFGALGRPFIEYDPRGFKVTYTGGYAVSVGSNSDPLDDFGVVQVPDGLKIVVAAKIAEDYKKAKMEGKLLTVLNPWTDEQVKALFPWTKRDIL